MVASVLADAADAGRSITIAPEAHAELRQLCTADLGNGGRGIRNKIEAHLINPLARALFERESEGPAVIRSLSAGAITTLALGDACSGSQCTAPISPCPRWAPAPGQTGRETGREHVCPTV